MIVHKRAAETDPEEQRYPTGARFLEVPSRYIGTLTGHGEDVHAGLVVYP